MFRESREKAESPDSGSVGIVGSRGTAITPASLHILTHSTRRHRTNRQAQLPLQPPAPLSRSSVTLSTQVTVLFLHWPYRIV